MDSAPSTLLAESLAAFSKVAHQAFATVDSEARTAVAQAVSETREARRKRDEVWHERDEAIKTRDACQLEMQILKGEMDKCKAALTQAEMTIAHREEIILQLRRERSQWKDQSRNWQEHFLRVEQERCRLSSRVDELTAEKLLFNHQIPPATYIPRPKYTDMVDPTISSSTIKRASPSPNRLLAQKSAHPGSSFEHTPPSAHKGGRMTRKMTPSHRSFSPPSRGPGHSTTADTGLATQKPIGHNRQVQSHHTISPAREQRRRMSYPGGQPEPSQVLIRRVKAVVQVPVKQEDVDEDLFDPGERSVSDSASERASRLGSSSVNVAHMITPSRSHSRMKSRTAHIIQSDEGESGLEDEMAGQDQDAEDEDDELRMGVEDNHNELYGTEPIGTQHRGSNAGKPVGPPNKKRKLVTKASGRPKQPRK